ncbi:MAG: fumarate hydratase C-terminal domain-containing protein [Methanobacterium sp.]|nr:fumarate hydratase C-terminal domain-containing protein [Methanobacterium sp.]
MIKKINFPLSSSVDIREFRGLRVGDKILIYGEIYTGRDAALPQLVDLIKTGQNHLNLEGSAIMHTAVSDAGISPTTSNKMEIEGSMPFLAENGVKLHIGKGSLSKETIDALSRYESVYVVTPPAAALLMSKVLKKQIIAFPEEGIEAIHQLKVDGIPGIVAVALGESL